MLPSRFLYDSMFGIDRMEDLSCDIYEKDNKYHLEMDIPGFTKDDIKIECHKGTITVSAKKNYENEEKDDKGSPKVGDVSADRIRLLTAVIMLSITALAGAAALRR